MMKRYLLLLLVASLLAWLTTTALASQLQPGLPLPGHDVQGGKWLK